MHDVTDGYTPACEIAEGSTKLPTHFRWTDCRQCLTAMVAHAVNKPTAMAWDAISGKNIRIADSALRAVRTVLADDDPLRVRAEQVLVSLVAVSTVTTE